MMEESTPFIPKFSVLSPLVTRIHDFNSYKSSTQGANTYLVGRGKERVLIDAGDSTEEHTDMLAMYIRLLGVEISAVLLTNCQSGVEHMLNHFYLGSKINRQRIYRPKSSNGHTVDSFPVQHFSHGQSFKGDSFTLTGYHTSDSVNEHMAYWLEEEKVLFSGDIVEHTEETGNFQNYISTLNLILGIIESKTTPSSIVRLYPSYGHYVSQSPTQISEFIRSCLIGENEVVDVLFSHHLENGSTTFIPEPDVAKVIYKEFPESIRPVVERGIHLQLLKLKAENKLESHDDLWRISRVSQIEAKL